jgi:outer membrane receptor protein involved in Fe transport
MTRRSIFPPLVTLATLAVSVLLCTTSLSAQATDNDPAALRITYQPAANQPPANEPAESQPAEPEPVDELRQLEQLLQQPVVVPGVAPIITSASRREERATAAPATVIVIDRRDIELRGYSQLIDVLRDLPGMETIEFFFSEFGTQVPIRGISGNNKIVVLVNGMRVNPPGGENFPFRSDFSVRHAERIEVVYGSGSTLYGQDAISAVINVVTIDPAGGGTVKLRDADDPLSFNVQDAPTSDRSRAMKRSGYLRSSESTRPSARDVTRSLLGPKTPEMRKHAG